MTADDGRRERDAGIASALDRPAADWDKKVVDHAIRTFAASGREFSANQLRELLPQVNGSIIGARFLAAARRKLIVRTGSTLASHGKGHRRRISTWRGTHAPRQDALSQPPALPPTGTEGFYAAGSRSAPSGTTPAGPEPIWAKARRLLADGQVRVRVADLDGRLSAHVRGETDSYIVHRTAAGRWSCSCMSGRYGGSCSHQLATKLIAAAEATP